MAYISCPCGFRAETDDDFDMDEAREAYDEHSCPNHKAVYATDVSHTWPGVARLLITAVAFVILAWICAGMPGVKR